MDLEGRNVPRFCVVSGTRADYGLLKPLMQKIKESEDVELQLIASGMHLSPEFGNTVKIIEADGFQVSKKVEMLLSSDSDTGVCKSMGLGMIGFADAFDRLKPDICILLGDRFEAFAAAAASAVKRIPIAHLHGGELSLGSVDDAFRHSITKMSSLHFTSTEEYRRRVIQLGEHPDRVFNVGAIGLDNISDLDPLSRDELEEDLGIKLAEKNFMVTYHPATLAEKSAEEEFAVLLAALEGAMRRQNVFYLFSYANADAGGRIINQMINTFTENHSDNSAAFESLGQQRYLSMLKIADAVVGNSSSGIIEAPSIGTWTVNIGSRQDGRIRAESVIDCPVSEREIEEALEGVLSKGKPQGVKNPYGEGGSAEKVFDVLRSTDISQLRTKEFYDLPVN